MQDREKAVDVLNVANGRVASAQDAVQALQIRLATLRGEGAIGQIGYSRFDTMAACLIEMQRLSGLAAQYKAEIHRLTSWEREQEDLAQLEQLLAGIKE